MAEEEVTLSREEMEDAFDVFDLFDYWDGSDGNVDGTKIGDMLRCAGLNPTEEFTQSVGGTTVAGEKEFTFVEFEAVFKETKKVKEWGTFRDFEEAFKSFDREGQGFISAAEMQHLLTAMADRLTDNQVDEIVKCTGVQIDLDGNVQYEDFINKVMKGPPEAQ